MTIEKVVLQLPKELQSTFITTSIMMNWSCMMKRLSFHLTLLSTKVPRYLRKMAGKLPWRRLSGRFPQ